MTTRLAYLAIVGLVAVAGTPALAQRPRPRGGEQKDAGQSGWIHSLDEGMDAARKTGKPLMIVIRCQP